MNFYSCYKSQFCPFLYYYKQANERKVLKRCKSHRRTFASELSIGGISGGKMEFLPKCKIADQKQVVRKSQILVSEAGVPQSCSNENAGRGSTAGFRCPNWHL
ncbi:hypothetical protein CEXT_67571 [Caerostris extrusa]|uniref:Uncharacterized protein n=1 Tax=Caerostris extrusa TaxID=172846 RepID=A0AAV4Y7U9_CAEEX|nr:hypothetical protein CEXT_67571 [Caerostris extrusa]